MALTDAQRRAKQKYSKNKKVVRVELFPSTEADIIEKLEQIKQNGGAVATYIKNLIRQDINK